MMTKTTTTVVFLALVGAALAGCKGGEPSYCIGTVQAEQEEGVEDNGFNNPDIVGTNICWADTVSWNFCLDQEGEPTLTDDFEDGGDAFCEDNGYVACEGVNSLYVEDEADCPSTE